jgi:hypothetical protein
MPWNVYALVRHEWKQWYNASERAAIVQACIDAVQVAYPTYYNAWVADGENYEVWSLKQAEDLPGWFMPYSSGFRGGVWLDDEPNVHIRVIVWWGDQDDEVWVCAGIMTDTVMDVSAEFDEA